MPRKHKQTPDDKQTFRLGQQDAQGRVICGAKTRKGTPCPSRILLPNGRCKMHGGLTPAGPASPHWEHGRHSKYLPTRYLPDYQAGLKDSELTSMRDELALVDVRIGELIRLLNAGGAGGDRWHELSAAYARLEAARAMPDAANRAAVLAQAITDIGAAIKAGADEGGIWADVTGLLEQRRRLAESERRRLVELRQMMTAEQAVMFMTAVGDIIRARVPDDETRRQISNDLIRLYVARTGRPIESANLE